MGKDEFMFKSNTVSKSFSDDNVKEENAEENEDPAKKLVLPNEF